MGLLLSGAGIGMLFSGIIVPYVVRTLPEYSWRGVWFLFGVITCSVVCIASIILKNPDVTDDEEKGIINRFYGKQKNYMLLHGCILLWELFT